MTIPATLVNGSTQHEVSANLITGMFVAMSERERLEFMYRGLDQCYTGVKYAAMARDARFAKLRRPLWAPRSTERAVLAAVDATMTEEDWLSAVTSQEPLRY